MLRMEFGIIIQHDYKAFVYSPKCSVVVLLVRNIALFLLLTVSIYCDYTNFVQLRHVEMSHLTQYIVYMR